MNRRTSAWVATHAPAGTRWGTKTLALLLSLVLCLTLLPGAAFAADEDGGNADAGKAIQLGTGSITGYAATNSYDCIYFGNWTCTKYSAAVPGPIKWRVLDTKTNMENAVDGDGLFLLSDGLYGIDDAGWIFFSRSNNAWQGSEAQEWCKIFAGEADATENIPNAFTAGELDAVLNTYKDDGEVVISEIYTFLASKQILNGDKVFFLSAKEAVNGRYGFSAGYEDSDNITRVAYFGEKTYSWWLRSPYRNDAGSNTDAGWVSETGYISMEGPNRISPARPAFNLDSDSVLFISAAEGGKHADGMDSGLAAVSDFAGSEWKLTLKDSTRSEFSAELESRTDSTVVVSYTGASAGTNEYVSAMVKNGDTVKYYGRIADVSAADGTVTILLPDNFSAAAGDKLYVFNEQYNGEKQTDYASELAEIQLDGSHTHCFCGGDVTAGDHTSHTDVTYQEWNGTDSITYDENGKAYVYLTDNAQFARDLNIDNGQTLYLCLNGKEYKCIDYGKINVNPGGCLYLCDCQGTGKIVGNDLISGRYGSGCINITGYYNQTEEPATGYIFGGTITGGVAKLHGGGIFVENNCILSIYGGTITGNRALWYGGGVHVMSDSVVNLYGGTITGNTTDRICGGMFVAADSELNISGAPVVEGNTDGEGACNILLADPSAKQINFAGEMTEGAKLGITVTTFSDERVYPAVFSSACDTDYSSYFFADNKEIHVEYNSDKKLQLAEEAKPHTHVWATEWSSNDTHHWHNCTADGCDITDNAQKDGYAAHSGTDDGNCTTAVDCETCGYQIKNAESAHNYPDTWTPVRPGSTHTRKCQNEGCSIAITNSCVSDGKATCQEFAKCTICGGDCGTKADHSFTAETVGEDYLKSAATCTAKAVYYKSCSVCGESSQDTTGEATFESGEFDASNHTGNLSDWQYNANGHWKEYFCCHAQPDAGTHSYDNETDTTCNICGYSRGKAEVKFNSITAVGNGLEDDNGKWLNDANWDPAAAANHMTKTAPNVYEITYTGVAAYDHYQVKFAANDGWTDNWGTEDSTSLSGNAVHNESYIEFSVETDNSTVKLVLDLSKYDLDTKTGATYSITVTPPHTHPICGATCSDETHTDQTWQAISTAEELSTATNGYYYLTNDVTLENPYIKDGVVLCLNGHSIKSHKDMPVIDVMFGRTFTLTDCTGEGTITHDNGNSGYGVRVYGGTFNLYGGNITGNGSTGVYVQHYEYVQSDSIFNMYGGSITGNNGTGYGGGVYVTSGCTFNMYGGSITGNKQAGGSGVDVNGGTFNLRGGSITGNTGTSFGGGVYVAGGTVNISGNPVIEGNTVAGKADNLYLYDDITLSVSEMTSGAKIGITTKDINYPVVFSSVCDTNYSEYFFADDANAHVEYNSDKKLQLAHTHAWATAWTYDETNHWHECANSGCDVTENSGKDGYSAHVYGNDTDATCNTCGYQRAILYTVTFNPNGGTLSSGEETAQTNADGKLASLPTPTRSGSYRFDGWYTEKAGGDAITTDYKFSADTTVYAHWIYTGGSSGSYTPSYAVTVEKSTNGSVTADRKTASSGTTVTITVTPDKGYTLETLTVTDKNGNELKLTEKNGKYTFTMPASKVTVKATFMDDNTMLNYFVDVKSNDYYYDAVLWAAQNGITSGTDAVHFSPDQPCTRAQIVTFLWRAAGSPVVNYAMNMTDVPEDAYYAEAVRWALSEGITTGTTESTFSPNETCTRAQAVAFLFRYAAPEAVTLQELVSGFSDAASVPGYALSAMNWALAAEIVQGDGSKLMPNDSCTRAQIVTFLYRALEK